MLPYMIKFTCKVIYMSLDTVRHLYPPACFDVMIVDFLTLLAARFIVLPKIPDF